MVRRADFRPARERIDALPADRRERIEAGARKLIEASHIGELRRALDVTQATLAERSGMKQAEISRIERAPETAKLMTVERYVESLGGSLKLVADFPDGTRAEIGMRNGRPVKSRVRARSSRVFETLEEAAAAGRDDLVYGIEGAPEMPPALAAAARRERDPATRRRTAARSKVT